MGFLPLSSVHCTFIQIDFVTTGWRLSAPLPQNVVYISKLQECSLSKAQGCKWFTQESSYCVISGQYCAACISCVIGTTGKPAVNHQPCQGSRASKAFEPFQFWTGTTKQGLCDKCWQTRCIHCMCCCMRTYGNVWLRTCLYACVYVYVCGPHMPLCAKEMADSEKCVQF